TALVRIVIEVIDATGIKGRRSPLDAVDDVAFAEKKLREIGPVLPGDARDQRDTFAHGFRPHPSAQRAGGRAAACLPSLRLRANTKTRRGGNGGAKFASDLMVATVPIDEPLDSLRDRSVRREANGIFQAFNVGVGRGHIPGLHRRKFANCRLAYGSLDD